MNGPEDMNPAFKDDMSNLIRQGLPSEIAYVIDI